VKRLWTPLAAVAILAVNLWLNGLLFMHGELPFRGSIEAGYRVGLEPRIMAAVSALAWVGALAALFLWRKRSDSATTN
jgi:hypothetical protein